MGVSQALLSHYEKGIRECGLDFLSRAAKFYGVTTDFMLGLTNYDTGGTVPPARSAGGGNTYSVSVLYKNLLIHALYYIFDCMKAAEHREAATAAGKYLSLAVYRLCGALYGGLREKTDDGANFAERLMIAELEYIIEMNDMGAPLGEYDFGNVYLNNIIKNAGI